jgi:hypothetical protein
MIGRDTKLDAGSPPKGQQPLDDSTRNVDEDHVGHVVVGAAQPGASTRSSRSAS